MRILIAKKNKFQVDAISTWLQENENCFELLYSDTYYESIEIYKNYQINIVILGESMHPKGQIHWLNEFKGLISSTNTSFIATISDIKMQDLEKAVKIQELSILHVNDAKHFFLNYTISPNPKSLYISPFLVQSIGKIPGKNHPLLSLSRSEICIAGFVVLGYNNSQVAKRQAISTFTISDHRKHIKEKLNVKGGKHSLIDFLLPYTLWLISDK